MTEYRITKSVTGSGRIRYELWADGVVWWSKWSKVEYVAVVIVTDGTRWDGKIRTASEPGIVSMHKTIAAAYNNARDWMGKTGETTHVVILAA